MNVNNTESLQNLANEKALDNILQNLANEKALDNNITSQEQSILDSAQDQSNRYTYLDWNSCGKLHINCQNAMIKSWAGYCYNTKSKHALGSLTRKYVNELSQKLLRLLDADEHSIIFGSGATEINSNMMSLYKTKFISDVEHSSILHAPDVKVVPVDKNGAVLLDVLEKMLIDAPKPFLVSVILANNETGIINDLAPVRQLVTKYGGYLHTDAAQAFGRIQISLDELDVDYMTISSHKFAGPMGVGLLVHHKRAPTWGYNLRTVPAPLIAGLVEALSVSPSNNSYFEERLSSLDNVVIVGLGLRRLPNTTCIYFKNLPKDSSVLTEFDLNNICVSTGSAYCRSYVSHTAAAMGIEYPTIRISSGWATTKDDFDRCFDVVQKMSTI
jgi:cysteine desulfurase